jgi:hypothetical protein
MKVIIACEESQTVCKAFRAAGHEAYSCDIQYCSGGHPEWHIMGDALKIINGGKFFSENGIEIVVEKFDLMIAHPPCTFLSNAAARWLYKGGKGEINQDRYAKGLKGKEFFMSLLNSPIEKIVIENPIPSKVYALPPHSQSIQPYQFGHEYSKKTFLWLKNLPPLTPTDIKENHKPYMPSNTGGGKRGHKATFVYRTLKQRSKTFEGIAKAMAAQWG